MGQHVRGTSRASLVLVVVFAALVLLRLLSDRPPSPAEVLRDEGPHRVERAVDGDTLLLSGGQRIRLIGVDTPETRHPDQPADPLGEEAARYVASLVDGRHVRLEFDRERLDRYGRLLAYVYLPDGRMLNEELIRTGYSKAETGYPFRQDMKRRFRAVEEEARLAGVGMWQAGGEGARIESRTSRSASTP